MYVALIILVLFLLLLFVPIKVVLKKDDFYIQVLFFKWRKSSKKQEKSQNLPKKKKSRVSYVKKIITFSEDIKNLAEYISQRCIVFENLFLAIDFGTGDAAHTGMLTGALNGAVYTVLSAIHHNTTLKKWDVKITPDFEREKFDIQYLCIVRVRIIHIISIGIKALGLYRKIKTRKER